jgi:hypothetical protein
MGAPSAIATSLTVYTTYMFANTRLDNWVNITLYGNETVNVPADELPISDAYMQVVYMYAESLSISMLSLTLT